MRPEKKNDNGKENKRQKISHPPMLSLIRPFPKQMKDKK